jgi:hypothetical protein
VSTVLCTGVLSQLTNPFVLLFECHTLRRNPRNCRVSVGDDRTGSISRPALAPLQGRWEAPGNHSLTTPTSRLPAGNHFPRAARRLGYKATTNGGPYVPCYSHRMRSRHAAQWKTICLSKNRLSTPTRAAPLTFTCCPLDASSSSVLWAEASLLLLRLSSPMPLAKS